MYVYSSCQIFALSLNLVDENIIKYDRCCT